MRLLGVLYVADIRETHMTYANSLFGRSIFTSTVFDMHQGQRSRQEDALGFYEEMVDGYQQGLWVIADGVTKAYAGDAASRYAVQAILWHYQHDRASGPKQRLQRAIIDASQTLVAWGEAAARANNEDRPRRSATTVAAIALTQTQTSKTWDIALVGDSTVSLLYFDDTHNTYSLKDRYADKHSRGELLQKALGKADLCENDIVLYTAPVMPGTMIMLATDGVTDVIQYPERSRMLEAVMTGSAEPDAAWPRTAQAVVQWAVGEREGYDNATVVIIRTSDEAQPPLHHDVSSPQICLEVPPSAPALPEPLADRLPESEKRGPFGRVFGRKQPGHQRSDGSSRE